MDSMTFDLGECGVISKGQYSGGLCSFISWQRLAGLLAQTGMGGLKPHEYVSQMKVDESGVTFVISEHKHAVRAQ